MSCTLSNIVLSSIYMGSLRADTCQEFLWIYQGRGILACMMSVFLRSESERCKVFLALGFKFRLFLQNYFFLESQSYR